ncbi:MAG TPA: LuxR C-terminal-related transcriptional regulator, partial [Candidatus Aquabacterium excrementipullorum]|nr:LuxR C-terminal-related transcriptional regulator [Candidatus Aquabacterium excrementipullorum]
AGGRARGLLGLVDQLSACEHPFVLFLDDVECIHEPSVLGMMRELIEHLPHGAQVVVGARNVPELGLGRLRAHGQLLEVDAEDLRFTLAEAGRFFEQRGNGTLPDEALRQLHSKTDGWIAPLWLASVALDRRGLDSDFIAQFSGSNQAVAHYLADAVLARQPQDVRQFLLRTSVLGQLDAPLCHALAPRAEGQTLADSERMLQRLESADLFIRPVQPADGAQALAGRRPGWRYHSLFADFLRAQLAREQPHEFTRLHLAASAWYEANGRPVPAIDHAIEGGDMPHALSLLAQHAQRFLEQGRMRLLHRWFGLIPQAHLADHPLLDVISVWATCFVHGPAQACAQLEGARCNASSDADVQVKLRALRPLLLAMTDHYEEAMVAGREALVHLPTGCSFSDIGLMNILAHVAWVLGDAPTSHQLLDRARRTSNSNAFTRAYTESVEGMLDLHEARLHQAMARLRMALGDSGMPGHSSHGNTWGGVIYASALYEVNRLDDAQRRLNVYLPQASGAGLPDHMIIGHAVRARIAQARGDSAQAMDMLADLAYLGHERRLPRAVAAACLERARIHTVQGQARAAREALASADLPGLWQDALVQRLPSHDLESLALGRLRWELAFGDAKAARPLIEAELGVAERTGRQRRAMKLRLLLAWAQHRGNDIAASTQTMEVVLRQACQEGFVRLVLDEGSAMLPLVQRVQARQDDAGALQCDPVWVEYLQSLVAALEAMPSVPGPADREPASTGPTDAAAITPQEVRILQLLAEGHSNGALAAQLKVSDSTVRTHLRNINAKLNAHNRMQAVATARRLAVIP